MAVLARENIIKAMDEGEIVIEPAPTDSQIGPASIDLHLSNEFRFFVHSGDVIQVTDDTDFRDITEKTVLEDGKPFLLQPGGCCLGMTVESVKLSSRLCGLLEGRSRFARLGLSIHITAGFMQPGLDNRQVLEIYNASKNTVALVPGTRFCQFIFMRMDGEAKYVGKFAAQNTL